MAVTFVVVTAVVGLGVSLFGIGLMMFLSGAITAQFTIGSASIAFLAAFLGILAGSMCVHRHSRIAACIVLTVIMLMVYQTFWFVDWRHEMASKHGNSSLELSVVAGGSSALVVAVLAARRRLKNDGESTHVA